MCIICILSNLKKKTLGLSLSLNPGMLQVICLYKQMPPCAWPCKQHKEALLTLAWYSFNSKEGRVIYVQVRYELYTCTVYVCDEARNQ